MSHKDDCYSPDYARERGREDYQRGWDSPYAMGDCYEAQRAYDEGVSSQRRYEQHRREVREQEEAAEMEYYYAAQQEAEYNAHLEEQMRLQQEAYYREMEYHERIVLECGEMTESPSVTKDPGAEHMVQHKDQGHDG